MLNLRAFPLSLQKLNEAAQVYEAADNFNQAASCYIRLKNWIKVGVLLPQVTSSKIHGQFAKVRQQLAPANSQAYFERN